MEKELKKLIIKVKIFKFNEVKNSFPNIEQCFSNILTYFYIDKIGILQIEYGHCLGTI